MKTILALTLYSKSSVRLHHKLLPRKISMWSPNNADAYTQVKMEEPQHCSSFLSPNVPTTGYRLPRYKWPRGWQNVEEPVVPLETNLCGQSLGRPDMGEKVRGNRTAKWKGESTNLGMSVCPSPTRTLFIGTRGRHQNFWKKLNLEPMWKMLV